MPQSVNWTYRSVEVNRIPSGDVVVVRDSGGILRANVPVAPYLSEIGRQGWEACGAFGHVGENDGRPEATIILKKQV